MTLETYDKAIELRTRMNYLTDIVDVLNSSKGNDLIARRSRERDNNFIEPSEILNGVHIGVSEPIIQRLVDVIKKEIKDLEEKFHSL